MIQIIETGMGPSGLRKVIDTAPDFAAAKVKVAAMGVSFMEDDADYADCADAFMKDGRTISIQPEGFRL